MPSTWSKQAWSEEYAQLDRVFDGYWCGRGYSACGNAVVAKPTYLGRGGPIYLAFSRHTVNYPSDHLVTSVQQIYARNFKLARAVDCGRAVVFAPDVNSYPNPGS